MKNIFKNFGLIIGLFTLFAISSCKEDISPIIEELQLDRAFSPLELVARIRNKTTAELTWKVADSIDHYVVEISEDSLVFGTIIQTIDVAPVEVPYSIVLYGETQYSARVKSVSIKSGVNDSKWSAVAFKTEAENIFNPLAADAVQANSVTLTWPAGSEVTHFIITPGSQRDITAEEKAAGVAIVTGLTGETDYTVKMFNNNKQRGIVTFKTLVDIGTATAVYPTDDLNAVIAAAQPGDVLALFPGDYLVYTGIIAINKSISIKGVYPYNKPIVHVQFNYGAGMTDFQVKDVEMDGTFEVAGPPATVLTHAFLGVSSGTYNSITIDGCSIHDYNTSLIYGGGGTVIFSLQTLTINNCIATNVLCNGGNLIDFRTSYIANVNVTNSTFNNCATARDFIRLDDASATFPSSTSTVLVDHCTFYGVCNSAAAGRYLYTRFVTNVLTFTNNIVANTLGYFGSDAKITQPTCSMNNYFNAGGLLGGTAYPTARYDISGNATTLDPGFANTATGDFKISNQTLIDNAIGDPRWRN